MPIEDLLSDVLGSKVERMERITTTKGNYYLANHTKVGNERILLHLYERIQKMEKELSGKAPERTRAADEFEKLWLAYPEKRRKAKPAARKAWSAFRRRNVYEPHINDVIKALEAQKRAHTKSWEFFRLIVTWIHQEGWNDVVDEPEKPATIGVSYEDATKDGTYETIQKIRTWLKEKPGGEKSHEIIRGWAEEIWDQLPEDLKDKIAALDAG